jgi:hypothetical protein
MNKKALAIIIGGLIVIAAIIYFIFIYNFNGPSTNTTTTEQTKPAEQVVSKSTPTEKTAVALSAEEASQAAAQQLALSFTERYGTSSNQADFSNLIDAEIFMTTAFKSKTNAYIAAERVKANTGVYQSIVTNAALVNFKKFDDKAGIAEGLVSTRRRQTATDGKVDSFNQDLLISLKKVANNWLVDSADWQK